MKNPLRNYNYTKFYVITMGIQSEYRKRLKNLNSNNKVVYLF